MRMNIVNVGYDSTNYYVLADTAPRLLIDVGWPGTLPKLQHQCKRADIRLTDIPYFLLTHYHPDHAGLAQELKNIGLKLIVLENQVLAIPTLASYMKPQQRYLDIALTDNISLAFTDCRAFLAQHGLQGDIIATPGHSEDSITLILDEGAAFVGDLPRLPSMVETTMDTVIASWEQIRSLGGSTIYPGHGPVVRI